MVDISLKEFDKHNMYGNIVNFHRQITEGIKIGQKADLGRLPEKSFRNIILAGMGGSAIGGDLLRSFLKTELPVPFIIHRNYDIPDFAGQDSLVICSSYSGGTEETLSAFKTASEKGSSILCISAGGKLTDMARENNVPVIKIPSGMMPRAALGYSFTPLLIAFERLGLCKDYSDDLDKCSHMLKEWSKDYSFESPNNTAYELAIKLAGKIVLIYSGPDYFDTVALRFKGQIGENSKQLAFCGVFPEFNHNELVGWELAPSITDKYIVLILRDDADHPQIARRMDIVGRILKNKGVEVVELFSRGESLLSRIFSQIQIADFASYYLALINHQDPTPIDLIELLKKELS